jgi:hypothetical protein
MFQAVFEYAIGYYTLLFTLIGQESVNAQIYSFRIIKTIRI